MRQLCFKSGQWRITSTKYSLLCIGYRFLRCICQVQHGGSDPPGALAAIWLHCRVHEIPGHVVVKIMPSGLPSASLHRVSVTLILRRSTTALAVTTRISNSH